MLFRTLVLLTLSLSLLLPLQVAAQGGSETITAQLSFTLPSGEPVSGTLVNRRSLGAQISSTWTFNGMINGQQFTSAGNAVERWLGDGQLEIQMTEVTEFAVAGQPPMTNPDGTPYVPQGLLQTVVVSDLGGGMLSVRGVPLALSGGLLPPGSGDLNYVLTNAGQGSSSLSQIPNTAQYTPVPTSSVPVTPILALCTLALSLGIWRLARRFLAS